MKYFQDLKFEKGFSLIEMLLALAIGMIGIFIFSLAVIKSYHSYSSVEFAVAHSDLTIGIRRALLDRRALEKTVALNPVLKAVVENNYSGPVTQSTNHQVYGIDLYDANGLKITGADQDATNLTATPVYYTLDGFPCTTLGVGRCFVSVKSSFILQGHPRMGTFKNLEPTATYPSWDPRLKPEFIQINFVIEYDPAAPRIVRKPVFGSVFYSLNDLGL